VKIIVILIVYKENKQVVQYSDTKTTQKFIKGRKLIKRFFRHERTSRHIIRHILHKRTIYWHWN